MRAYCRRRVHIFIAIVSGEGVVERAISGFGGKNDPILKMKKKTRAIRAERRFLFAIFF